MVASSDDINDTSSSPEPTPIESLPPTHALTTETVSLPERAETMRLVSTETVPRSASVSGSWPEVVLVPPITMVLLPLPAVIDRPLPIWTLAMVIVLLPEVGADDQIAGQIECAAGRIADLQGVVPAFERDADAFDRGAGRKRPATAVDFGRAVVGAGDLQAACRLGDGDVVGRLVAADREQSARGERDNHVAGQQRAVFELFNRGRDLDEPCAGKAFSSWRHVLGKWRKFQYLHSILGVDRTLVKMRRREKRRDLSRAEVAFWRQKRAILTTRKNARRAISASRRFAVGAGWNRRKGERGVRPSRHASGCRPPPHERPAAHWPSGPATQARPIAPFFGTRPESPRGPFGPAWPVPE